MSVWSITIMKGQTSQACIYIQQSPRSPWQDLHFASADQWCHHRWLHADSPHDIHCSVFGKWPFISSALHSMYFILCPNLFLPFLVEYWIYSNSHNSKITKTSNQGNIAPHSMIPILPQFGVLVSLQMNPIFWQSQGKERHQLACFPQPEGFTSLPEDAQKRFVHLYSGQSMKFPWMVICKHVCTPDSFRIRQSVCCFSELGPGGGVSNTKPILKRL